MIENNNVDCAVSSEPLFKRFEGNPLLTVKTWPYRAHSAFNPGATIINGETLLLARVEDMRGFSHLTVARSADGKTGWRIGAQPALVAEPDHQEEHYGVEDARIIWLEPLARYAVTYTSFIRGETVVSLAATDDFEAFDRYGRLLPPEDKDAALFPKLINGRFALIHRPIIRGEAHMWISFSPDLKYWGDHRLLMTTRASFWDAHRVGLGPTPIETPEGWLVIYHGVRATASGSLYRTGLALLDLNEPWRVIRRSQDWVFGPSASYEMIGDVPGVIFPNGATVDAAARELRLYYGAADSVIALATADFDQVMEYLLSCEK
jgi:beta-1,4-mannooligosaccharide/beta-1,4-mannosyl-N-acetylglucosamine phosphorylase